MTMTKGAGVTECQDDWTIRSIFEDWIADKNYLEEKLVF